MPENSITSGSVGGVGSIPSSSQTVLGSGGPSSLIAVPVRLAEILGAEIMRPGTWNGNKFTPKDLQDIAAAASEVGYTPPLKVGHDESVGARAWGWVRNIRLAGERLVADLMDIPDSLAAVIRERGYDALSSEIYIDLDRDGKRFRRALKAVALLGAEVPAVSGLKPLRELFSNASAICDSSDERNGETVLLPSPYYQARAICFTTNQPDGGRTMPEKTTDDIVDHIVRPDPEVAKLRQEAADLKAKAESQAAQLAEQKAAAEVQAAEFKAMKEQREESDAEIAKLKEETAALQAKNREIALTAKLDQWRGPPAFKPFLEVLYRTSGETPRTVKLSLEPDKPEDMPFEAVVDKLAEKLAGDTSWMIQRLAVVAGTDHFEDPGAEVDARARRLIAQTPALPYQQAVTQVLDADQGLKAAYAGV